MPSCANIIQDWPVCWKVHDDENCSMQHGPAHSYPSSQARKNELQDGKVAPLACPRPRSPATRFKFSVPAGFLGVAHCRRAPSVQAMRRGRHVARERRQDLRCEFSGRQALSKPASKATPELLDGGDYVAMPCKHGCMLNVLCFPQNAAAPHFRVTAHMVAARAQGSTLVPIRAHVTPPPHVARPSMGAAPVPAAVGTA